MSARPVCPSLPQGVQTSTDGLRSTFFPTPALPPLYERHRPMVGYLYGGDPLCLC